MKRKANSLIGFITSYKTLLLFLLILLSAGLFRLTYLRFVEFKGDEALNLLLATRPLFGHPFPAASLTSSVGILNFPLVNYFLFPMVLISTYPPFVSFCIGFINTIAIGLFFLILKKYFSTLSACITCLLFSFAPWPILYSRKIWEQDFIIPLVVGLLFAFFKIYLEKKKSYYILYIFLGLLLVQIHQIAGILPVILFPFLLLKQRPPLKLFLLGLFLGILPMIPYVLYQFHIACPACSVFSIASSHFLLLHPEVFLRPFEIVSMGNIHSVFGDTDYFAFSQSHKLVFLLMRSYYLIYLFLPVSIVYFWYKEKKLRLIPIIVIGITLIFFLLRVDPQIHYFIVLIPFLFLFLGFSLASLIQAPSKLVCFLGVLLTTLFVLSTFLFDLSFFQLLSQKQGFGGDYGASFAIAEKDEQENLSQYKNRADYNEIILAYHAPKEYIEGSTPVGQMLYPYNEIQKDIPSLTQKILILKNSSPNPLVFNELLAYYTYPQNESTHIYFQLRNLGLQSPVFQQIAIIMYNNYLEKSLRHSYSNTDFLFEYPSYWSVKTNTNSVIASDDKVTFLVSWNQVNISSSCIVSPIMVGGLTLKKHVCLNKEAKWVETDIDPIVIGSTRYTIHMQPLRLDGTNLQQEQNILDSITSSFVILH